MRLDQQNRIPTSVRIVCAACLLFVLGIARGEAAPNLAPSPGFESSEKEFSGWYPVGVVPETGPNGIAIVAESARTGEKSLRITPGPSLPAPGFEFYPSHNGDEGRRRSDQPGAVRGARTFAMRLEPDVARVTASVWIQKPSTATVSVSLVWTSRRERQPATEVRRCTVDEIARSENGWNLYRLEAARPVDADRVQCVIETDATEPIYIDDVALHFPLALHTELLVDQLGYEPESLAKFVVLQSTIPLADGEPARLVNVQTGQTVQHLAWRTLDYLPEWDRYHWRADFSDVRAEGRYRVEMPQGAVTITSPEFAIRGHLLLDQTAQPAYRFYYYQRCGCEVPGFHRACHLDDAKLSDGSRRDLTGGWHDAGDYNKYNGLSPEAVHVLAYAWHQKPDLFDRWDVDHNGRADILDEALWGGRFVRKMLDEDRLELLSAVDSGYRYWGPPDQETDNLPGTGDERSVRVGAGDLTHCSAAFALLGRALAEPTGSKPASVNTNKADAEFGRELIALAERLHAKTGGGVDQLISLFIATGKPEYRQGAEQRATELLSQQRGESLVGFRELAEFAIAFPEDEHAPSIRALAARRVAELRKRCDPRFGIVCDSDASGRLIYFRPYTNVNDWYVGDASMRLDAAIDALYAARLGAIDGRALAEQQVHWLLGCNPFGTSYMEGIGSRFVPGYHHRYNSIAGNPRGAVPGALINGIVRPWPHIDRPWLDLHPEPNADYHSNEPWLLHNNRWLQLLALW